MYLGWNTKSRYWIGGRENNNTWEWYGLRKGGEINIFRWAKYQPRRLYTNHGDCIEIVHGQHIRPDYFWKDADCQWLKEFGDQSSGFFCERNSTCKNGVDCHRIPTIVNL